VVVVVEQCELVQAAQPAAQIQMSVEQGLLATQVVFTQAAVAVARLPPARREVFLVLLRVVMVVQVLLSRRLTRILPVHPSRH
jgi:hypothetical protein